MGSSLLGLSVNYCRGQDGVRPGINITNYEMINNFTPEAFRSVVLDESSILKAIGGKTKQKLIKMFSDTKYRLCCTATPAPNDLIELGNHAEFLGICKATEMQAMFFINANKEHTFIDENGKAWRKKGSNNGGQEWRLKHPAEKPFFRWLSNWAMCLMRPSDLGYGDDGFDLPPLNIKPMFVNVDYVPVGQLFFTKLSGISDRANVRRKTLDARLAALNKVLVLSNRQWIIWVGLDSEAKNIMKTLDGNAREVRGSDSPDHKAKTFEDFQDGRFRILVTKPRIGGFGMNFQNASNMMFFGLNDSWESWYQCIRRQWRFGQDRPVNVYVISSNLEIEIYQNIMRKDAMAKRLRRGLIEHASIYQKEELMGKKNRIESTERIVEQGGSWEATRGDSCEELMRIDNDSIDLSVYSPPFADLFTYTESERDLGNCRDWSEFFKHYKFIVQGVLRATKPGRISAVHVSDIPAMAVRDGYIGVRDFPGEVIRAHEQEGWIFSGRAFIQKNPQAQAIRVKSKALLFVQIRKDSAASRPALIDQILIFKKPGDNAVPITPVANNELDNETWINWAHGIWFGIRETETLQYSKARDKDDEKHICPLQLGTIERCIKLWSNPKELILDPFMGIGSTGYMAIALGRRFLGIELKKSYYQEALKNLRTIETQSTTPTLFDMEVTK